MPLTSGHPKGKIIIIIIIKGICSRLKNIAEISH